MASESLLDGSETIIGLSLVYLQETQNKALALYNGDNRPFRKCIQAGVCVCERVRRSYMNFIILIVCVVCTSQT